MLQKLRSRLYNEEKGFTLIELLVVILIIGILAAIALPAFLGQRTRGQDASAKSNARNLVSELESCYTTEQDYANCATSVTSANTGLNIAAGAGGVQFVGDGDTFTVTATSVSDNVFTVAKDPAADPILDYDCTTAATGACPDDGNWNE